LPIINIETFFWINCRGKLSAISKRFFIYKQ
jgi:hypothetical protein